MKTLMAAVAVVALTAGQSFAGGGKHTCAPCPSTCEWKEVECKVMVPEWTTEKQTVECTEYQKQMVDKQVTVYERVKKEHKVQCQVTVYERQIKQRDVTHCVRKPVWKEVDHCYTVCVPQWETHKGTRCVKKPCWKDVTEEYTVMVPCVEKHQEKVCVWKCVPVEKTRTICVDEGHWEEKKVEVCDPCNACCPKVTCVQKCWVPKIVEKKEKYTCHEWKQVEEIRECEVTVCKPEVKKCTRKVCEWVTEEEEYEYKTCVMKQEVKHCKRKVCEWTTEEVTRKCNYVECVPVCKTIEKTVCEWECVPVCKTIKECVCVPVTVKKEIEVPVCRMVEKTRTICVDEGHWEEKKVEVCDPCNACCPKVTCVQKCWVPKIVEKQEKYTCHEWKQVEEIRECEVTVCKPEVKKCTRKVCEWVTEEEEYEYKTCVMKQEVKHCKRKFCEWTTEEVTRKCNYVECVPVCKTIEKTVCEWECVPVCKTIKECVYVPVTVKKEIEVPVCRMVEKTITQKVPVVTCCKPTCCEPDCNTCCN